MVLILHNIRSLHNVGSIFRTADGAGMEKIYLTGYTPTPLDRFGRGRKEITKTALGAERFVPWAKAARITLLLGKLRGDGYKIAAIEQSRRAITYYNISKKILNGGRLALVLGNEVGGIPESVLRQTDTVLQIPMYGQKESLNVSVAAGVVLFGILRLAGGRPRAHNEKTP